MKKFLNALLILIVMIAIVLGCYFAFNYFTKEESQNIEPKNEVKTTTTIEQTDLEPIYTEGNYPVVDGSTATIPLSKAFKRAFTANKNAQVKHNKTHSAYVNLINGDADLILVTAPSEDELKLAKEKGVELEVIPVVNEAFVFFVNYENNINSISLENIRKIYAGEIKNWSELGGKNEEIKAYQRPVNSGSQTGMLELVMQDKKIVEAPKEDIIKEMDEIVNLVSNYDNGKNAIGYSYYYYATTMYDDIDSSVTDRIKFVAIDGVEPANETIINGTYPIRTAYYIVINAQEPEDGEVRKLVNEMLSDRGQKVAEEAGYVPLR